MKILSGHTSPDTAYLVDDYPYGFRLRCQIRYWLEDHPTHGTRLVSQTSNPKLPGIVWNKPKPSTYAKFAGCLLLNDEGHITWTGLTEYSTHAEAKAWYETYRAGLTPKSDKRAALWVELKRRYEEARDAGKVTIAVTTTELTA